MSPGNSSNPCDGHFACRCGDPLFSFDASPLEDRGRTDYQGHPMNANTTRRQALATMSLAMSAGMSMTAWNTARADTVGLTTLPTGASLLRALTLKLAKTPRRRDFKSVPMILTRPEEWDAEALTAILSYKGGPKQAFDNTELEGPWLNLMRNSMNAQVWSWKHPDFLCASVTHGTAHLALYDDFIWDKYQFAKLTKDKFESNTLARLPAAAASDPLDFQKADGLYSPAANSIPVLQRRGAVFIACHNQVWEITAGRIQAGVNPDRLSHEALAAEFTNHLIADVVLSPGAIGTMPELLLRGFAYAK